ncbi:MAG: GTPase Era [Myxococcota bacterium]|nr:GTPase Era [Myxococcota bacterium]
MTDRRSGEAFPPDHRAGFVALLGPPNAGKSTLLNRLLGEKLAIVTAKPQTTRSRILGILTLPSAQLLLQDTPGLHESGSRLNTIMNESVGDAIRDCDVGLLMVDRAGGWTAIHDRLLRDLRASGKRFVVVGTKGDLRDHPELTWPPEPLAQGEEAISISGLTGEGVAGLLESVIGHLPESPRLYPEEELTDRPLRWLCGEMIREAVFHCLDKELPYAMAVEVIDFDEARADRIVIHANLLVERDSQKRIVVGSGGRMVKGIGMRARKAIETWLGTRVHLQLFVKVDPRWLKSARRIEELGYR